MQALPADIMLRHEDYLTGAVTRAIGRFLCQNKKTAEKLFLSAIPFHVMISLTSEHI